MSQIASIFFFSLLIMTALAGCLQQSDDDSARVAELEERLAQSEADKADLTQQLSDQKNENDNLTQQLEEQDALSAQTIETFDNLGADG